jgi:hypothetical protein
MERKDIAQSDHRSSPHLTGTAFFEGKNGQILRDVLDLEISFGRRILEDARRIELSTLPEMAGSEI